MTAPLVPADRALRVLTVLLAVAVTVSVVHYADNYLAYAEYPRSETLPNPSRRAVGLAWLAFTAFGIAGYLLFRAGRTVLAGACLAVYAGSGLIGIGHYAVPEVTALAWWRHVHIGLDIACGLAVLAFALWTIGPGGRGPARG